MWFQWISRCPYTATLAQSCLLRCWSFWVHCVTKKTKTNKVMRLLPAMLLDHVDIVWALHAVKLHLEKPLRSYLDYSPDICIFGCKMKRNKAIMWSPSLAWTNIRHDVKHMPLYHTISKLKWALAVSLLGTVLCPSKFLPAVWQLRPFFLPGCQVGKFSPPELSVRDLFDLLTSQQLLQIASYICIHMKWLSTCAHVMVAKNAFGARTLKEKCQKLHSAIKGTGYTGLEHNNIAHHTSKARWKSSTRSRL